MSAGTPIAAPAPAVAAPGAAVPAASVPAPSPQYTPPPPPMPTATAAEGQKTSVGGKFSEFFSDVNILDVTISAFIVGAVLYSIQYHKFMMMLEKTGYADLSTRVQKMESALEAAKKKSEMNAAGSQKKKRRLITL